MKWMHPLKWMNNRQQKVLDSKAPDILKGLPQYNNILVVYAIANDYAMQLTTAQVGVLLTACEHDASDLSLKHT